MNETEKSKMSYHMVVLHMEFAVIHLLFGMVGGMIRIILGVIGFFIGHIICFDSILCGIITGIFTSKHFALHPAFCVLCGIVVFAALLILHETKFGFWILGIGFSAWWTIVALSIVSDSRPIEGMMLFITAGILFVIFMGLHFIAKNSVVE